MEANAEDFEFQFDNFSPYDIADVVKGYFRDLPEPLMTGKLSQTFTSIFLGLNFPYLKLLSFFCSKTFHLNIGSKLFNPLLCFYLMKTEKFCKHCSTSCPMWQASRTKTR